MVVKNGKCYPDNPKPMLKIVKADAEDNFKIRVLFNNAEERMFDGRVLLSGDAFAPLSDESRFRDFRLDFETLTWMDGQLDVAPEFVYEHSR